jgi:hypothetical protein
MSMEVVETESDIYRQYDRALTELANLDVSILGPDFDSEVQPEVEAAVRRFLAGELVRQGHAKLRARGVSDDLLPSEDELPRVLELDLLPEADRQALEKKLRNFAAQTIRDPEGGGELPTGGGGPTPWPTPPQLGGFVSQIVGGSCIHAYQALPGVRMGLVSPLPPPPPGRTFVTVTILGWMYGPYGTAPSGDVITMIVDDGTPFRLQPSQMLVSLVTRVDWAKEIVAWNSVRGRLSSVFQPGPSPTPTTMLLTQDCEGTETIAFRKPMGFGFNWVDLFHFDPRPFWATLGGRRLAFTWLEDANFRATDPAPPS